MKKLVVFFSILCICTSGIAYATTNSFQGFETDTGDWNASNSITRVASGSGTLGLTAASGGYYAEITNLPEGYGYGYGDLGYSRFGFATPQAYEGNFSQSIALYIDNTWPTASPNNNGQALWIDMSPRSNPSGNYGAEHNFRLTPTGSAMNITVDGQTTVIATIASSGWITFEMTYRKGANATDLVSTDMNVYNNSHTLLGTTTVGSNSPGGPLLSSDLGGPGYVWLTAYAPDWGAGETMAIDNVRSDLLATVPEPATMLLLGLGLVGLAGIRRRMGK